VKAIDANTTGVQGDVAKMAELDLLYETVRKVTGRVDIVFINVGSVNSFPSAKRPKNILTSCSTSIKRAHSSRFKKD